MKGVRRLQWALVGLSFFAAIFSVLRRVDAEGPDLPISAAGTWQAASGLSGAWQATLALTGNQITGTIQLTGHPDLSEGSVSGNLSSGGRVEFGVLSDGVTQRATFVGVLDQRSLGGEFQTKSGSGLWGGDWRVRAPQVASQWPPGVSYVKPVMGRGPARPSLSGVWFAKHTKPSSNSTSGTNSVAVAANVLVNNPNDSQHAQNEPHIAVDRVNNHNRLVAAANDYSLANGQPSIGYYFSADKGSSWPFRGGMPGVSSYDFGGDPVVDFDTAGRAFLGGLAYDEGPVEDPCDSDQAVVVSASLPGVNSFLNAVAVTSADAGSDICLDKPWMTVDTVPGSVFLDNVYVTYTVFAPSTVTIRMAISEDHGQHFGRTHRVSDGSAAQGSYVAIGKDGVANVVWQDGVSILYDRCSDSAGEPACGTDRIIAPLSVLPNTLFPGTCDGGSNNGGPCKFDVECPGGGFCVQPGWRVDSYPRIAIDTVPDTGPTSGLIYVVWADYRSGNSDIYFTRSVDNGVTFLPERSIASLPTDEFFPAISVDLNHIVRVVYYQRTSTFLNTFNIYEIFSVSGGDSFTAPVQINDGGPILPVQFAGGFIGDYIGVATSFYRHPAWMDSRRGNQDIYTAVVSGC